LTEPEGPAPKQSVQNRPNKTCSNDDEDKNNADSSTKVSTSSQLFCGRRKVVGIRVDENLYLAFKPVAMRVFGSVCRPVESFMATIVALDRHPANFGNTVEVGTIVIERNLRERRRLVVDRVKPIAAVPELKCDFCSKVPVVASFRHMSGIQKRACGYCAEQLRTHPRWESASE